MAEEKKTEMLDPIAYRPDYNPNDIIWPQNANINYWQYWDDSNPEKQQESLGWLAEKNTWEWVANSNVGYNANIKTWDLDPNYLYWEDAKKQNAQEAWYIAKRNDNIASALYNEWKVTKDDVAMYLAQQNGFANSTVLDRKNTAESIYKRLWQFQSQNEQQEEGPDTFMDSTEWKVYWKTTAENQDPTEGINTLSDANSVFKAMDVARVSAFRNLQSMDSWAIAASIWSWTIPYWEQAMRDLQSYNFPKWQEVQDKLKELKWQDAVNAITTWNTDYVTAEVESKEKQTENDKVNKADSVATSSYNSEKIISDINNDLSDNAQASTAEETMANITNEMNKLKTRLSNLRKEANNTFRWDVPDYIVQAYINNRTQEINDRLKELQYNYDAAYQRNRDAIDDARKWREYNMKVDQLEMQRQQQAFNQWYQQQTLARSNIYTDDNGVTWQLNIADDGSIYYTKIEKIQTYTDSWMTWAWLKNNNPWNIKDTQFWVVIWTSNWFAQFATPEDWFDALVEKMKFNQTNPKSKYYWKTILEYYQIYAPESDWNDPVGYAKDVVAKYNKATWQNVTINTKISELDPWHWAWATAKHDSWYDYSTYWQFRQSTGKDVDLSDIEIPYSIFDITDENWVWITLDPNSEEWKQRIKDYVAAYIIQNWIVNTSDTSYNSWPISSDWITPELFRQRIYNLVPAWLKNGDQERENLYDIAKTYYLAWYTADEAALAFYWVDVHNDKTWLMQTLVDIARSSWTDLPDTFYWNMWSFTERNLSDLAVKLTENSVLPEGQRQEIAATTTMLSNLQNVKKTLESVEWFWPISGRINELKNKFKSNKDYQTAVSAMQNAFAELRKSLLWSQITEEEAWYYDKIFPDETDVIENVKISIDQTETALLNKINNIRKTRWLPEVVSIEQALYPSMRTELYIDFD